MTTRAELPEKIETAIVNYRGASCCTEAVYLGELRDAIREALDEADERAFDRGLEQGKRDGREAARYGAKR